MSCTRCVEDASDMVEYGCRLGLDKMMLKRGGHGVGVGVV